MLPRRLSTGLAYTPIGARQHPVTIMAPNPSRDDEGEFLPDVEFATTWASIISLQGRDLEKAQQVVAEVSTKVVIPYISGVTSAMKVKLENRTLIVRAVNDPDERKVELWLYCEERNDGAAGEP